ncbi:calcium regulated heat stable protein 1, isoform CRA_b [Rattus norvegicus]|uniref:Calcium regulated heat stable protein 1, isoform CRA_b n=1 Tax=Rattus norvegicus TaxID=10116 RepID=A6K4L8_RAT|nr:calcium regulated heat stable protein 1, isoform CRA_b [Rattus norvegicus]
MRLSMTQCPNLGPGQSSLSLAGWARAAGLCMWFMYVQSFPGDFTTWCLCSRCVSTFWERLTLRSSALA